MSLYCQTLPQQQQHQQHQRHQRAEDAAGTGKRRRERQLRQFLRHERLTVAMLLADMNHPAAPRGQTKARSGEGRKRDALHGRVPGDPPPHPELFKLFDEEPGGEWPEAFAQPRPPERVQRHTVEQLADFAPVVQILDVPVPQMVDQLVAVLRLFEASTPEHVNAVPKISCPSRPGRAGSCRHADGGTVGGSTSALI